MKRKLLFITLVISLAFQSCIVMQNPKEVDMYHKQATALYDSLKVFWTLDEDNIKIQKVIIDQSKSKNDLYVIAKNFIAFNYIDPKSVIQVDDKENGIIIVKGLYSDIKCEEIYIGRNLVTSFKHILKIEIKDYSLRATIYLTGTNVYVPSRGSGQYYIPSSKYEYSIMEYYPLYNGGFYRNEKEQQTRHLFILSRGILRGLTTTINLNHDVLNSKSLIEEQKEW
ncbi:MAG: DUF4468 domain-containing protein [Bacteroidales bacterium]